MRYRWIIAKCKILYSFPKIFLKVHPAIALYRWTGDAHADHCACAEPARVPTESRKAKC